MLDDFSRGRLANLVQALESDRVTVVEGDIRDPETVAKAMAGIDLVYHQAAIRITRCAEEPRLALEVLADGTFNVVEAAVDAGVTRVIAASSASVYGQADVLPTDETHHPWNNDTLYGAAKAFNEGILQVVRARCAASTTWLCATSTSTDRAWTSTASTPRCWCAGWSGSRPANPR